MAPLRDGVGLVDDEQRDAAGGLELGEEALVFEALGRNVDQLRGVLGDLFMGGFGFDAGQGGIEVFSDEIGVPGALPADPA